MSIRDEVILRNFRSHEHIYLAVLTFYFTAESFPKCLKFLLKKTFHKIET